MALNDADIAVLATELTTDPIPMGYSTSPEDDPGDAALLNVIGGSSETIEPNFIEPALFQNDVDVTEFEALTAAKQRAWNNLLVARDESGIAIKLTGIRAQLGDVWTVADSPITRTALLALTSRDATRGEVLFGESVTVTSTDIARARGRT